jgi:predicted nucleic acid-binding Zn ribbon protein
MTNIKNSLKDLLYKIAGEKYRDLLLISLTWKSLVGEILSERSKIIKYEKKVLYVKAVNHVWLQEFVLQRPELLAKLKEKTALDIENILFVV